MATVQETLVKLNDIKQKLVALKLDRTKFLSGSDFTTLYTEFENVLKDAPHSGPGEELRVAETDVLTILSLGFLTVGLSRQAPATYATLTVVRLLLRHLTYAPNFTPNEVQVIERRLDEIEEILDTAVHSPTSETIPTGAVVSELLHHALAECKQLLLEVQKELDMLHDNERMAFPQVLHLRRDIFRLIVDPAFETAKLAQMRTKLEFIVSHMFAESKEPPQLSRPMTFQIDSCRKLTDYFTNGPMVAEESKAAFAELTEMDKNIQVFLVTHRWTLRETDLYRYITSLHRLDTTVISIIDATNSWIPEQRKLDPKQVLPMFMVRKCVAGIYKLLDSAEPVTEALIPVHNQLVTTRRCLVEVQELGGISSLRELYPYQMKLDSLDNMRKDGKFVVGEEVPAGQGVLNGLLAECFDLVYDLQVDLEERSRGGSEIGDDNDRDLPTESNTPYVSDEETPYPSDPSESEL